VEDTFRVLDCHVHPGIALPRAAYIEGEIKYLDLINKASLDKMNLLSTLDAVKLNQNPDLIHAKLMHPHLLYIFGALEYPTIIYSGTNLDLKKVKHISLVKQVDTLVNIGFDGIKMIEGHARWRKYVGPLNTKKYKEYFKHMEAIQFPIIAHAKATALSTSYVNETEPRPYDKKETPLRVRQAGWYHPLLKKERWEIADVIHDCPNLKIIFAHFGGLSRFPEQASEVLDRYKNVYLDVTPGYMLYDWSENRETWRELFIKYQDRILFGSDASGSISTDQSAERIYRIRRFLETDEPQIWGAFQKREPVTGLTLPKHVLKIDAENFERVVGETPKKLNIEQAIPLCERMARMMKEAGPWYSVTNIAELLENALKKRLKE
jgi:predicted TIM-barrel fold metal-dependent hydrolase